MRRRPFHMTDPISPKTITDSKMKAIPPPAELVEKRSLLEIETEGDKTREYNPMNSYTGRRRSQIMLLASFIAAGLILVLLGLSSTKGKKQ
jgi:hypothetical protein